MSPSEKKSVFVLASIYATRMLGLFMILPVFMALGGTLTDATPALLGMAIGIYGLAQALLQLPFGIISDRIGRRPLIYFGLTLFALGSIIAGMSDSVWGVIVGRFLQGSGAIASVLMALLSDLTSEESRTPAMAIIGMSIGVSFSVATILGPVVAGVAGLHGIFFLTAVLAGGGMLLVRFVLPVPRHEKSHRDVTPVIADLTTLLRDGQLLRLNLGILTLHLVMTAVFVTVPGVLIKAFHLEVSAHWWVYLSLMVPAFFVMVPFMVFGERKRKVKPVFLGALVVMAASLFALALGAGGQTVFWVGLFGFFVAFNFLEASLPSLVSKQCPAGGRGSAMGIYSSFQFFGAFLGGALGGWVLQHADAKTVLTCLALAVLAWGWLALTMQPPQHATSLRIQLRAEGGVATDSVVSGLMALDGVFDVRLVQEERAAYLKVDRKVLDEAQLRRLDFVESV